MNLKNTVMVKLLIDNSLITLYTIMHHVYVCVLSNKGQQNVIT